MELFDYEKEHIGLLRDSLAECTLFLRQNIVLPYMEDLKTDVIPEKGGEASGTES